MKNTVSTNLLGRWVKGRWIYENPDYVHPDNDGFLVNFHHTKKQQEQLTEYQMSYWAFKHVEGPIVAVSTEGTGRHATLVFWILVDGKPVPVTEPVVMPAGYEPMPERL